MHNNVTLPRQAEQLRQTLLFIVAETWGCDDDDDDDGDHVVDQCRFDLVGFSLGGRIAMAFACLYPTQVRTLHLTGVAWDRSARGKMNVAAWKDILSRGDSAANEKSTLQAFAWLAILSTYSPSFLLKQRDKIPIWVDVVASGHSVKGLSSLMEQTHPSEHGDDDDGNAWTVPKMAHRIQLVPGGAIHLVAGEMDEMVALDQVHKLAKGLHCETSILPTAAHAVPFEAARAWRATVLRHLDQKRGQ